MKMTANPDDLPSLDQEDNVNTLCQGSSTKENTLLNGSTTLDTGQASSNHVILSTLHLVLPSDKNNNDVLHVHPFVQQLSSSERVGQQLSSSSEQVGQQLSYSERGE